MIYHADEIAEGTNEFINKNKWPFGAWVTITLISVGDGPLNIYTKLMSWLSGFEGLRKRGQKKFLIFLGIMGKPFKNI